MKLSSCLSVITSCVLGSFIIYKLRKKSEKKDESQNEILSCFFFLPEVIGCTKGCLRFKQSVCESEFCNYNNYNKILTTLSNAKDTLEICVCLISDFPIYLVIEELLKKGVIVRIISDDGLSHDSSHSMALKLRKLCVPFKLIKKDCEMMHHKFAIIDKKLLLCGSCNWTKTAFRSNYENVIITNNSKVVANFYKIFEVIWNSN